MFMITVSLKPSHLQHVKHVSFSVTILISCNKTQSNRQLRSPSQSNALCRITVNLVTAMAYLYIAFILSQNKVLHSQKPHLRLSRFSQREFWTHLPSQLVSLFDILFASSSNSWLGHDTVWCWYAAHVQCFFFIYIFMIYWYIFYIFHLESLEERESGIFWCWSRDTTVTMFIFTFCRGKWHNSKETTEEKCLWRQ